MGFKEVYECATDKDRGINFSSPLIVFIIVFVAYSVLYTSIHAIYGVVRLFMPSSGFSEIQKLSLVEQL